MFLLGDLHPRKTGLRSGERPSPQDFNCAPKHRATNSRGTAHCFLIKPECAPGSDATARQPFLAVVMPEPHIHSGLLLHVPIYFFT